MNEGHLSSLRILVVDDHETVRRSLRSLLSSRANWVVCGEAADGLEAVEKAKALRPNVVLMDISMPGMNGFDATRIIRRELPESKVVIVSQNDPTIVSRHLLEVDAAAYVAKADLSRDLLATIDRLVGHRNTEITSNEPVLNGGENVTESTVSQKGNAVDASIPDGAVSLESILCTEELHRRPSRPPDYEKENRALVALAQALADSPRTVLQTLADTLLDVCRAGSAGISLLTTDRFYWPAIAGSWKSHIGGGTPRDFGPCGDVLDRKTPLLFSHVERRYTYFQPVTPPVEEALLVPFYVGGKAVGTIWVVAHDYDRKFDAEDERIMGSLGKFASSAYQILASLDALKLQITEREKAEASLRLAHQVACVGAFDWNIKTGVNRWTPELETMYGLPVGGFAGTQSAWEQLVHREDRDAAVDAVQRALRDGAFEGEWRVVWPDGSVHWLLGRAFVFQDQAGEPERLVGVNIDVSERKKTEFALQESERRFRAMIDALPAAIYTTDADGRLTHFNPAAVELSGRAPQLGNDRWCVSWKLFHPDGTPLPHEECPMAIALKEGRIVDGVEAIAERPDGKRVWFTPYPRPLRDAEGRIVGGINMLVDITERKRAEGATGLLAAIVDSSDDAIISKTLGGVITSWNTSAEWLFGYTADEAIGQHITLIVPPDRLDEEATILERLQRGERIEHFETVRVRKNGTLLDISLTISPVKDASGRVVGASKVARDITERKRVERALRQSEERLRTLADGLETEVRVRTHELEQRNAEVVQQSEQLRELSNRLLQTQDDERRHIARELHDSAGQIVTALGMNLASITPYTRQHPQLGKAIEDSQELVQQLSKEIRTTSYLLHPPLLDESGLSEAIRWYMQGLTERSALNIDLSISENFGRLPGEMELAVFRIVQECLTNIHRHSDSQTATIRLARTAESVSLEIQDEGKGISAEQLAKIQGQRSGVGITGMRERVRHFGGVLNIQSNDRGTKIRVTFPVATTATAEPESIVQRTGAAG